MNIRVIEYFRDRQETVRNMDRTFCIATDNHYEKCITCLRNIHRYKGFWKAVSQMYPDEDVCTMYIGEKNGA